MSTSRALCVTPRLAIQDIACSSPRSRQGAPRGGESTHVVFVRRGAFAVHLGARRYVADPCTALVSWEGTEYRISHPCDGGDDCTVVELEPELAGELLARLEPRRDVELRLTPAHQTAYARALAVVTRARGDRLVGEEVALELVGAVTGAATHTTRSTARRRIALAAVELLNADPSTRLPVSAIAGAIGCSPHHLMHAFRAELGTTLRGYRLRLRLAAALHRLAAGHDDLAALAAELGFASHAHLTGAFSRLHGLPPRDARTELRTFVEARLARRA